MVQPSETFVGTVNEDFAVESMAGDVFQLGNASWRILGINSGTVRVEDAHGQPPGIPFWLGEAPGRTAELSRSVSQFREDVERQLMNAGSAGNAGNRVCEPSVIDCSWVPGSIVSRRSRRSCIRRLPVSGLFHGNFSQPGGDSFPA